MEKTLKILIFGSSGMLGRALCKNLANNFEVLSPKRSECDLLDLDSIEKTILDIRPNYVINAAALVDVNACENNRDQAFKVNSLSVYRMALSCNLAQSKFIQISTDHFYENDGCLKHSETAPISIVNYYAYTKYAAEIYAMLAHHHLILRTNIVGLKEGGKTFLNWALDSIISKTKINLFGDYFTSSIDIWNFSDIVNQCIRRGLRGLYNIGSSDVVSKAQFIEFLARDLDIKLIDPNYTSIKNQSSLVRRADSLGLDVSKIEADLGAKMPNNQQVIKEIIKRHYESK